MKEQFLKPCDDNALQLSICILTHNQPQLLPQCVASCVAEIKRSQIEAEIVIVDNASRDGYPQKLAQTYPPVRIIRNEENAGFSAGNNQAIRESRGREVLILNDDAVLQKNCLGLMIQRLESDPQIGAVGPKLLNPDGSVQTGFTNKRAITLRSITSGILYANRFFGKWRLTRRVLTQMKDDNKSAETDEVAGACLLLRREALDAVGLFDETFYYWSEDSDLCCRLRRSGWKVFYLAEAQVTHYGSASLGQLERFERSTMFYQSLMHFLKKHWSPGRYHLGRVLLAFVFLVRAPLAFINKAGHERKNLEEAKRSATIALRIARWLITERR